MPDSRLRGLLLAAGAGALLILIDPLGTAGAAAGVGLIAVATLVTASAAPRSDPAGVNWWGLLATGAALALVGVPLGLAWETGGGLLAGVGAALAVVGVALGLP